MKMCRGFTLLELMVTIAVLAILTTIAVPNFRDLVQNNRVTTQANELVTALNFGRTEAVKRGRPVAVLITQEDPGWKAEVRVDPDGTNELLREVDREGSVITVNGATVRFGPTGVRALPIGVNDFSFEMEPKTGSSARYQRCISVGPSGQLRTTREGCP